MHTLLPGDPWMRVSGETGWDREQHTPRRRPTTSTLQAHSSHSLVTHDDTRTRTHTVRGVARGGARLTMMFLGCSSLRMTSSTVVFLMLLVRVELLPSAPGPSSDSGV